MHFKPILALHIIHCSSCRNYWGGGGQNDMCAPKYFHWTPRIDASVYINKHMHGWQKYPPQNNTHNCVFFFCLYVNVAHGPERTGTVLHAEMLPEQPEKKNTESIITMATASNTCQGCSKNSKQRWRILMMVRDKVNIKLLI